MKFKHLYLPHLNLKTITRDNQRYYVTPSGQAYPSVTTVLGQEIKPEIQEWKESLGPINAAKEVKRCADRGTSLHNVIEQYLNNQEIKQLPDPLTARLFSQMKMRINHINNIHLLEAALYNDRLRIAGRVDCVADFDDVLSIIDFKTSNNSKTANMVEDYKLQCTAYAIMYSMLYQPVENIVIIIGIEKGIAPQVFRDKIDNYIAPLLKRINTYHITRTSYEH